jgi:glycosyltransferase involved in cell wall biosynthesis
MRIEHFYGRMADSMGLSEDAFIAANSRPGHAWNECLRQIRVRHEIANRIVLYTGSGHRSVIETDGLEWALVPATWGHASRHFPLRAIMRRPEAQFSRAYLAELRRDPPDLFVFYGNVPTPFSSVLARQLIRQRIPYVVAVHSPTQDLLPRTGRVDSLRGAFSRVLSWLRAGEAPFLFRHAGAVLVLTPADRNLLVAHALARPERIHVLPSGVHPRYFHPGAPGERGPFPQLCFVGRLEDAKGFDTALRCLAEVRRPFPDVHLHVAGTWATEGERRASEAFIAEAGLGSCVRWLGWLGPEALGDLMRASHLLVFPSRKEGLPRAVLEAMMCGTPVAALERTGAHDAVIRHRVNGILTSESRYAEEVSSVLADRATLTALSRQAHADVEREYSLAAMLEKVERVYLGLLASGGAHPARFGR